MELVTHVFNINLGYNKTLMDNCETLHGYAVFVDLVRKYQKAENSLKEVIDECISDGILTDFLKASKTEILKMSIYEYDEAKHIRWERKIAREEGWNAGRQDGLAAGRQAGLTEGRQEERQNSIRHLIEICQEFHASEDDAIQKIMQKYSLSKGDAQKYVTQYWETNI